MYIVLLKYKRNSTSYKLNYKKYEKKIYTSTHGALGADRLEELGTGNS